MKFVEAILKEGGTIWQVGGSVRDEILGIASKDLDLVVCNVPLYRLVVLLSEYGDTELVGKSFGVIKFRPLGSTDVIDIALPREERSIGPGHKDFEVEVDHTIAIEDDLSRRDFTMNSIAKNFVTGEFVDPYNGRLHIGSKLIHAHYENTFIDDPLRMLRAVQFAVRFGFTLSPTTEKGITLDRERIKTVSGERVATELMKILMLAPKPSLGFYMLRALGLLKFILPELEELTGVIQPRKHHHKDAFDHVMLVLDAAANDPEVEQRRNPDLMLGALFHDLGKKDTFSRTPNEKGEDEIHFYRHQLVSTTKTKKIFKRIPFNAVEKVDPATVTMLVERHMDLAAPDEDNDLSDKAKRRLVARLGGIENTKLLLDLRLADKRGGANPTNIGYILDFRRRMEDFVSKKAPFSTKDLAIDGNDIMTILSIGPGPQVGKVFAFLLDKVLDDPDLNNRMTLEELVRTEFGSSELSPTPSIEE